MSANNYCCNSKVINALCIKIVALVEKGFTITEAQNKIGVHSTYFNNFCYQALDAEFATRIIKKSRENIRLRTINKNLEILKKYCDRIKNGGNIVDIAKEMNICSEFFYKKGRLLPRDEFDELIKLSKLNKKNDTKRARQEI